MSKWKNGINETIRKKVIADEMREKFGMKKKNKCYSRIIIDPKIGLNLNWIAFGLNLDWICIEIGLDLDWIWNGFEMYFPRFGWI